VFGQFGCQIRIQQNKNNKNRPEFLQGAKFFAHQCNLSLNVYFWSQVVYFNAEIAPTLCHETGSKISEERKLGTFFPVQMSITLFI